jgi:hypothetical protein
MARSLTILNLAARQHLLELKKDDVVTAIMRLSEFAQTIADVAPGSPVYLTTWRNGENIEIRLTLGSMPDQR